MSFQPVAPLPPALPASNRASRRLDQMTAALGYPSLRPALAGARWLTPPATQALALANDPEFLRLVPAIRSRGAQPGPEGRPPALPPELHAQATQLAARYPLAFAAIRAGVREPGAAGLADEPRSSVIIIIVTVHGAWELPADRALLETLARYAP